MSSLEEMMFAKYKIQLLLRFLCHCSCVVLMGIILLKSKKNGPSCLGKKVLGMIL